MKKRANISSDNKKQKQEKKGLIRKIKALIDKIGKKNKEPVDPLKFERDVCGEKLEQLKTNATQNHTLLLGIRPERIKLEKRAPNKKYKNSIFVTPTVCELLGGEYNVHFNFCGKDMVGSIDAKEKITTKDEIAVSFSLNDLYVFDPITGDIVK